MVADLLFSVRGDKPIIVGLDPEATGYNFPAESDLGSGDAATAACTPNRCSRSCAA